SREARFCPDDSVEEIPIAASRACVSSARFLKKDTVKKTHRIRHRAVAAPKSTRRAEPVLTLEPEAPMAAESASSTSLKRWVRKSHCGTLRVAPTGAGACRAWGVLLALNQPVPLSAHP